MTAGTARCDIPLILGSPLAYAPALVVGSIAVLRAALEDGALRAELPGYAAYARGVRWRLVPGVW
jgi:protein-S-isoprenylcysteine O-methyltransferase Ste14